MDLLNYFNSPDGMRFLVSAGFWALGLGLIVTLIAESLYPRHQWSAAARWRHAAHNAALWLVGMLIVSVLYYPLLVVVDLWAVSFNIGLLRQIQLPLPVVALIGVLSADFADYLLHRLMHRYRPLWLLHMVHHADTHLDASTNFRAHPLSFIVGYTMRMLLVVAIGAPAWTVALRDLLGIINSHLHHAAIAWSPGFVRFWRRWLEWLFVSPTQHWRHHEPDAQHTNSNFGQVFTCWDRMFGTYVASAPLPLPASGLNTLTDAKWHTAWGMLLAPWRARKIRHF